MKAYELQRLAGLSLNESNGDGELKSYYAVYDRSTGSFIHLLDGKHLTGAWSNGKPLPFPQRSGLTTDMEKAYAMMDKALELPKTDQTYENFDPAVVEILMRFV